ncbi:MAG: pectin acetylesterase-family hydrolase [Pseudomonadales bacterium]|nr:pectin acetylesterase-family hydrolase [Pseudomonadales bacterium]
MRRFIFTLFALLLTTQLAAQSELPPLEELESGWNSIPTGGLCSTGTDFQFYVRDSADSDNLLLYFNGGGACWFGQACDLNAQPNVHSPFADMPDNTPDNFEGIFDLSRSDNPLADYDMVMVPYCTGDVHVGGGEQQYSYQNSAGEEVSVTTYHNGYENSSTVLDWVYSNYSAPEKIVIAGSSAGAIGSSFYSGLVAEHYGDTPVILIADAAGGYNSPSLPVTLSAWQTASILPDWPEYAGETDDSLTFEDFYIASANHNDNLVISQYNAAEDEVQYNFSYLIGDAPGSFSLPERIFNHYVEIESAVDDFYHYTAGGPVHTILRSPIFYDYEVEGIRFADWVSALISDGRVSDVSCVNEASGCKNAP